MFQDGRRIILLQGAPGSGKTTLARHLLKLLARNARVAPSIVCPDDFRYRADGQYRYDKTNDIEVHRLAQALAVRLAKVGVAVIYDATNTRRRYITDLEPYILGRVVCTGRFQNSHGVENGIVDALRTELDGGVEGGDWEDIADLSFLADAARAQADWPTEPSLEPPPEQTEAERLASIVESVVKQESELYA